MLLGEAITGRKLSRSRLYQKHDHRVVEQQNDPLVCRYLGTIRLQTPEQVQAMNVLSEKMCWYGTFFQSMRHLQEKTLLEGRHWDEARAPDQRLIAAGILPHHTVVLFLVYWCFQVRLHHCY